MTLLKCWAFLSSSQGTNGPRAEAGRERGLCTPMTSHGSDQKESACKAGDLGREDPWVGKISWRRA